MNRRIPIIIPAYEPDERLIELLKCLKKKGYSQIIIVNDGSGATYDAIFQESEKLGAQILCHEENKGKGRALKTAFLYCLENYHDLIGCVTADSDGQHSTECIGGIIGRLEEEPDNLILGTRDFSGEDVPAKSQFGNNLTRKVFKKLYKTDIPDTQTGLRGIPKSFMKELLEVPGERFEFETRMLIKAVETNVKMSMVPIATIYDSKENHSTHFRPIVDSIRIYRVFGFAFGKFVISSLSSSAIDIVLFQFICSLLRAGAQGTHYVIYATVIARTVSAIYNYSINYFMVFKSKKNHLSSAMRYFLLAILQMGCSALLTSGLIAISGAEVELLIKVPVDVVLFFVSYQIQKKVVY